MENNTKICPSCQQYVSNIVIMCPNCKYDFLSAIPAQRAESASGIQTSIREYRGKLKKFGNHLMPKYNQKYDMESLEGINAIPVPAKNYNSGDWTKDCIYYVLQQKATQHKRNGRMDLAIACLRKSNELSDYEDRPLLMQKDYFRLVKYLEYDGQVEMAATEANNIYRKHPDFLDKRISNLHRIKAEIAWNRKNNNDLVILNTRDSCPICKPYNRKIYSISGKSKLYPVLPKKIYQDGGFCPDCIISLNSYFEGISTPPSNISTKKHTKKRNNMPTKNHLKPCPICRQSVSNIAVICPNCKYDFINATTVAGKR